jgi:hypothetical protein
VEEPFLEKLLVRKSEGVSERKTEMDRPWRFDLSGNFQREGDGNCGYALFLYLPLDQTHGLIAEASRGAQNHDVNAIFPQFGSHFRGYLFHERD